MRPDVDPLPGWSDPLVEPGEGLGGDVVGRHRRIRLVTDIVIAGGVMGCQTQVPDLLEGFALGPPEVGCFGVFLIEVAQVDDVFDVQRGHEGKRGTCTGGLLPSGLEFERRVADVEHIVRVGDDDEFVVGGGKMATIEQGEPRRRRH